MTLIDSDTGYGDKDIWMEFGKRNQNMYIIVMTHSWRRGL